MYSLDVAGSLWENAMKLLSILKTYGILQTSSTGLKMSLEQALVPDVGEDCQVQASKAPAQVKKQKPRNRRPRRIQQFFCKNKCSYSPEIALAFTNQDGGSSIEAYQSRESHGNIGGLQTV